MNSNNFAAVLLLGVVLAVGCVSTGPAPTYRQFAPYTKAVSPCEPAQAETGLTELDNPGIEVMFSYPSSWQSDEWTRYSALRNYYFREADGAQLSGHPLVSVSSNAVLVKGPGSYEADNPTLEKYLPARLYEIDNAFGVSAGEVSVCSTTLAGMPAYKLSYALVGDAELPDSAWNYAEIFAVDEQSKKIYSVFYKAQGSSFATYLPGFEAVAQSLRIK